MKKSNVPVVFFVVLMVGFTCALAYYGGLFMRTELMRVGIQVHNSTVIITNNNDSTWASGTAYLTGPGLDGEDSGFVAHFVGVEPGGTIKIPFSEVNEFKNAKSLSQLPVRSLWIRVKGYRERGDLPLENIIAN